MFFQTWTSTWNVENALVWKIWSKHYINKYFQGIVNCYFMILKVVTSVKYCKWSIFISPCAVLDFIRGAVCWEKHPTASFRNQGILQSHLWYFWYHLISIHQKKEKIETFISDVALSWWFFYLLSVPHRVRRL